MLNPADSRNFYRIFQALALIIAPLLLLVGAITGASTFPAFDDAERSPRVRADADSGHMESEVPSPHLYPEFQ